MDAVPTIRKKKKGYTDSKINRITIIKRVRRNEVPTILK